MEVLDFMNAHDDWEDLLAQLPYCIKVRRDNGYILLKYSQFESDMTIPLVRECRGSIFYQNDSDKYECVCYPFSKFGNVGETYVPDIDWESAVVEEKVDGSLTKLFYHNSRWNIATNGLPNAFLAEINDKGISFGDLFHEALGGREQFKAFCSHLDTNETYMFELVSLASKLVVYYPETRLYYLGQRNMTTMQESKNYTSFMKDYGVLCPKVYNINTLEGCLEYVKSMTRNEEGFVVRDKNFNRMKIKSPEYLIAFHMDNNGVITTKRIVKMLKNETIDDFLAYCPEYKNDVQVVLDQLHHIAQIFDDDWNRASKHAETMTRKEFAALVSKCRTSPYLFEKYNHPNTKAIDWILSQFTRTILRMLNTYSKESVDLSELISI